MSSFNGGDQAHNPWSLDINHIEATERQQDAQVQHIQYQAQQMRMQFDSEMDAVRLSNEEQRQRAEMLYQRQINSMRQEVEERGRTMESSHNQQLENLQIFYDN
ncbi:hypothetical protein INT47_009286 [Mucor saturninus]|uniref:Uncharacterized protein n=1 Tax=Mucor saturninus TaxID=64648 RepID=A0A8H7QX85_9FUNG|nr:hypothetical protein INT47_009286 [Mucor saturninus]